MKNFWKIVLVLILSVFYTKAQTFEVIDGDTLNVTDTQGLKQGLWITKESDGYILNKVFYKNNLRDSIAEVYEGGKLSYVISFKGGVKNGKIISYWSNGNIYRERYYVNDTLNGVFKEYDMSGIIVFEENFINGKLNGKYRRYYNNGRLWICEDYKDNVLNGFSRYYHRNGNLESETKFKNGIEDDYQRIYSRCGRLKKEHIYQNNKYVKTIFYYKNGNVKKVKVLKKKYHAVMSITE